MPSERENNEVQAMLRWPTLNLIKTIECFHMTSRRPYWCPKTMERRPCWCSKPVLWELNSFLMQTLSFVPINLHRFWTREWKHSIVLANLVLKTQILRFARALNKYYGLKICFLRYGKTENKNVHFVPVATLLQNALNSNVESFTTHE